MLPLFRNIGGAGFPGPFHRAHGGGGPFRAVYHGYSVAFLEERERASTENGGKILLPQAALEQLVEQHDGVMLFKLHNRKTNRVTHCGVLEFLPNETTKCFLPSWMMHHLLMQEGDELHVESIALPTARFARFQPQSADFLDISNPKAVLETALRKFSCLTKDDVIAINYLKRDHELRVLELKPADAVTIIECDMEVDFAPPVGYIEPKYTPSSSQNIAGTPKSTNMMAGTPGDPQLSIPNSYKSPAAFMPFHGTGNRLNGKTKSKDQDQQLNQPAQYQQTRGIPNYEYEYGTLQFMRVPLRSINDETTNTGAATTTDKGNGNTFQPFSGQGQILKQPRQQKPKQ